MGSYKWKNVVQTERDLKKIFPKKYWNSFIFKLFGLAESIVKQEIVMELLVKFVSGIKKKKPIKTNKLKSCENSWYWKRNSRCNLQVDENFLNLNSLTKSTMKLVNEKEFKKLISNLKIEETISGGSNSSNCRPAKLGNEVGFIGKVNDDG